VKSPAVLSGGPPVPGPAAPPAPDTPAQPSATRELDRSLMRGLAWTGAARWLTQLLSWASTLVVARLLTPTDYGLVGMALVYFSFMQLVNEFGLGAAIVTLRHLTEPQVARLGGLALLLSCGFVAVSVLLAGPVATFFGEPAVRWLIIAYSVGFITSAVQTVPRSLLQRDLDFRRLAGVDGAEALVQTLATLALAVAGFRYWSLVGGFLVARVTSAALLTMWRPHRFAWPRGRDITAEGVTFGWQIALARIAWYLYSNADFAVVGRVLGKAALGAYTLGWTIASIPVDRVTSLVGSVTPAVLSAVQHDRLALQRYLKNLTEGLSLITFPASVGIALVADQLVVAVLGDRWRPAIVPLQLLALSAALRSVSPLLPPIIVATGHTRRNLQFTVLAALILPTLFYLGTHWGTAGVAAAWVVGHPVFVMSLYVACALRVTGLGLSGYLRSLAPATGGTLLMSAVVLGVRLVAPDTWPVGVRLGTQVLSGVVTYGAVVYLAHGARVRALWTLVRDLRR
jgi:O-antigen/teichoic acid export membrane protein